MSQATREPAWLRGSHGWWAVRRRGRRHRTGSALHAAAVGVRGGSRRDLFCYVLEDRLGPLKLGAGWGVEADRSGEAGAGGPDGSRCRLEAEPTGSPPPVRPERGSDLQEGSPRFCMGGCGGGRESGGRGPRRHWAASSERSNPPDLVSTELGTAKAPRRGVWTVGRARGCVQGPRPDGPARELCQLRRN